MGLAGSARLTFVLIARVPSGGVARFQAYEDAVLPLLSEFGGLLERRLRNGDGTIEVHIVSFDSDQISSAIETIHGAPRFRICSRRRRPALSVLR